MRTLSVERLSICSVEHVYTFLTPRVHWNSLPALCMESETQAVNSKERACLVQNNKLHVGSLPKPICLHCNIVDIAGGFQLSMCTLTGKQCIGIVRGVSLSYIGILGSYRQILCCACFHNSVAN